MRYNLNYNQILKWIKQGNNAPDRRVVKTDKEWKDLLTSEQYQIMRKKGTEAQMSSRICALYEPGIYACAACNTPLFDSVSKYDSGSGWPSFSEPLRDNVISYHEDTSYSMSRIEVVCSTCDAHLGHVFPDGPEPTGLRYCINGVSLSKIL